MEVKSQAGEPPSGPETQEIGFAASGLEGGGQWEAPVERVERAGADGTISGITGGEAEDTTRTG